MLELNTGIDYRQRRLCLQLARAPRLIAFLSMIYLIAIIVITLIPIMLWWQIVMLMMLGFSYYSLWQEYYYFNRPKKIRACHYRATSGWSIQLMNGQWYPAKLTKHIIATRFYIVLKFKCQGTTRNLMLTPEQISREHFRQLQVMIKVNAFLSKESVNDSAS